MRNIKHKYLLTFCLAALGELEIGTAMETLSKRLYPRR
jgi:hypothetical protein